VTVRDMSRQYTTKPPLRCQRSLHTHTHTHTHTPPPVNSTRGYETWGSFYEIQGCFDRTYDSFDTSLEESCVPSKKRRREREREREREGVCVYMCVSE